MLGQLNPAIADQILWEFPEERRARVLAAAPAHAREQWVQNHGFAEGSIGRLMEAPIAVFRPGADRGAGRSRGSSSS